MRTLGLLALIGSLIVGAAAGAHAQGAAAFEKQIVVSAGVGAAAATRSAIAMPSSGATEPQRQTPFTLFRTESRLESAPGFDARVAYALSRAFSVEVAGTFSRPTLAVRITQDSEGVAETRSSESIDQYTVEFSGLFHLRGRAFGACGSAVCDRRRWLSPAAPRGSLSPRDGSSGIRGRRRALLAAWAVGQAAGDGHPRRSVRGGSQPRDRLRRQESGVSPAQRTRVHRVLTPGGPSEPLTTTEIVDTLH